MSLIPAGLLDMLPAELWDKTGSVQKTTGGSNWANVSGMADIACRVMPIKSGSPAMFDTYPNATNRIQLKGAYEGILPTWSFLVGTKRYQILHASTDGSGVVTTLLVEQMEGTA